MSVSSGLPRRPGLAGITRVIRARVQATTVDRPTTTKGTLDEEQTTTSEHQEDIWLFEPRESVAEELTGERINGALGGLALADGTVDLQHNDRVTRGGVEFEIDTVVGYPGDQDEADGTASPNTDFWTIHFVRRQT